MSLFKLSAKRETQDNVYDVANNNYLMTFVSVTVGSLLESNGGKNLKKDEQIYFFSFVETPRKFIIIAELSIRKLGSSSVLIIPQVTRNAYSSNIALSGTASIT